jgi:hypothetical protein
VTQLAWLVGALATVGSALGAAVENHVVVREAAYGYRPQDRSEENHQDDVPSRPSTPPIRQARRHCRAAVVIVSLVLWLA